MLEEGDQGAPRERMYQSHEDKNGKRFGRQNLGLQTDILRISRQL